MQRLGLPPTLSKPSAPGGKDLGAREVFRWVWVEKTSKTEVSDTNLDDSGTKFDDFHSFGYFGNWGAFLGKHFSKKSISYETSGQTHKLKRLVYGSSNHDLFKKKVDSIGKLHSSSRILVGTLFFI